MGLLSPKKGSGPTDFLRLSTMGCPNVRLGTKCLKKGTNTDNEPLAVMTFSIVVLSVANKRIAQEEGKQ